MQAVIMTIGGSNGGSKDIPTIQHIAYVLENVDKSEAKAMMSLLAWVP